jgi:stress response protein YsnF
MSKMKVVSAAALALALAVAPLFAAQPKTYQVTGSVVALTDDVITVLKGKDEHFEIARDASVKVTGELKVGAKVTVEYRMSAASIDVKPATAAAAKKPAPAAKTTAPKTATP